MRPIAAEALVPAPREEVFAFLRDLRNHWLVADRFVEVVSVVPTGGVVRVSGPLGLGRTAATRITEVEEPLRMSGTAEIGTRTRARVTWWLIQRRGATAVRLTAVVERCGALDRVLLMLGGQRWLRRRFASTLARLAQQCEHARGARRAAMPAPALSPGG